MASNNAKAYDRVFVAGEAAVQRHAGRAPGVRRRPTGAHRAAAARPAPDPLLAPSPRRTVLYAPTWEGDAEYNDYTSVDTLGPAIVRAILAVPDVRLVYKPHPKVTTSRTPASRDGPPATSSAWWPRPPGANPPPATRRSWPATSSRSCLDCDAMVTDVSSVGLDWLYLRTEKPIFITDRHDDAERLRQAGAGQPLRRRHRRRQTWPS